MDQPKNVEEKSLGRAGSLIVSIYLDMMVFRIMVCKKDRF